MDIKELLATEEGQKAFQMMVAEQVKSEQSSEEGEGEGADVRSTVAINPQKDDKPSVTGERVPHWRIRGFRALQSQAGLKHNEAYKAERFKQIAAESARYYIAMSDDQRKDEMQEAERIVSRAVKSGRIGVDAQERILNLLDDPLERDFLSQARAAGHSGLTGPSGEFLIPKPMLATLHTIIEEYGIAQRLASNITLQGPGNSINLNSIKTAPEATWTGEDELFTVANMTTDQNVLTVNKLGAVSSISMELEEDVLVPLIPAWLQKVGENIALKIDQSFLIGDGTSTYGLMTGIANKSGVQTFTVGAGDLAPADLVEADYRTLKRLLTTARRVRAQWVMPRILWDHIEEFESGLGARIVQEMLTADARMRFIGFPVNMTEAMDNTDSDVANRDFAILGDFSRAYFGTKRGITVETSTEAVLSDSSGNVVQNAFQQDSRLIKISLRVGHQVPVDVQDGFAVMNAPAS